MIEFEAIYNTSEIISSEYKGNILDLIIYYFKRKTWFNLDNPSHVIKMKFKDQEIKEAKLKCGKVELFFIDNTTAELELPA